jgi:hypothetical protein
MRLYSRLWTHEHRLIYIKLAVLSKLVSHRLGSNRASGAKILTFRTYHLQLAPHPFTAELLLDCRPFDRNALGRRQFEKCILVPGYMDHPEITKLKSAYGRRILKTTLRDANADRQHVSVPTRSAYAIRLALKLDGRKTEVCIGNELARISTFGEFALPRITVNDSDRCGFRSKRAGTVRIGADMLALFTEDRSISDVQSCVLDSKEMRTLIAFHSFRRVKRSIFIVTAWFSTRVARTYPTNSSI